LLIETTRNYGRDILLGIAQYVRVHPPWSIQFQEGDPSQELPRWFKEWRGDGIIARVKTQAVADAIARLNVPAVDLFCGLPGLKMASIRSDGVAVGRMGAKHFLERGFRHFAYCGFNGTDWSERRLDGFSHCLAEAGFSCEVFDNPRPPLPSSVLEYEEHGLSYERHLARWLKTLPKATGLMACNDVQGRQVLDACQVVHLAVPDDIAVIGVDRDELLCGLSDPPMSSIILNGSRIGYQAAELLDHAMRGKPPPQETILIEPMGVATRRSTDVLSVEDSNLAKALLFIRDHSCDGVSIDDVAAFAGLSRSVLQRRFRAVLKQTVHEAILKVRLNRARELLGATDLPMIDIAEKAGFKHSEYMGAVFKAQLGSTPAQFRSQSHPSRLHQFT
jgi:LacI family transcriptional regulator